MTQTERELLEALKEYVRNDDASLPLNGINTKARVAIAKAEAEQAERVEPVEEMQDEIERLHEIIETNKFYQQGHQDALEWAAQCIEYDDPRTGDWMWDDRDVLAAVVRKGFELPYFATPPAAALEGGTVASGNIVGAVASGNIVGAVASGNQLSGAHNIRSK